MRITPRFEHDCVNPGCCTFVGRTLRCDVYTYKSSLGEQGIIMRHGSDGPDYSSWPLMRYARMAAHDDAEMYHAVQMVDAMHGGAA